MSNVMPDLLVAFFYAVSPSAYAVCGLNVRRLWADGAEFGRK